MAKNRKKYSVFQLLSAILMILALLWLTISIPFVYAGQQELSKHEKLTNAATPLSATEEENANPFGNNTEEKAPNSTSFSEEYLHDNHKSDCLFSARLPYHKGENADAYTAFHGEVQVPPPNIA